MTEQPGRPDQPETPEPTDPAAGEPTGSERPATGFDAAFEGEGWDVPRRRRRSSSSRSSSSRGSSSRSDGSSRHSASARDGSAPNDSSSPVGSPQPADSSPPPHESLTPPRDAAASEPSGSRASRSSRSGRRSRPVRRTRRVRTIVVHVVLGLLGLGLAWIVVTGLLAAYQLDAAKTDLTALRSQIASGGDQIDRTADDLGTHAHRAAVLTRGPAWATLAAIPYVGDPFDAIRGITTQTSALADGAVPGLVAAADDVNPRTLVQAGKVDLVALQRAAAPVHTAAVAAASAEAGVAGLPTSTWLPPLDSATADLRDQLGQLSSTLRTTDQAVQVLPTMLGGDGRPRKYFVAFQNNAELRGTGGLPGAFAIVSAVDGKVSIERFESDSLLGGVPSGLDFGKAYDEHYAGDDAYTQYVDSNGSPHFPYAAQIWLAMWRNGPGQGEQLDGALTVDPGALSYLLAVTGPATAPDGTSVTSDNVVALLQKDAYAKFPDPGENDDRRAYILGVASAVEKKVLAGSRNSRGLLDALARGVSERRIVAWSTDPTAEAVLASAPIGGTVSATDQPYSLLVLNNGAAGKLDYYLGRSVRWERTGCGDTRQVTVTIALTNNAPTSGLPPYVTTRLGIAQPADLVPGQNRTVVDYVATKGAQLLGATLDGQTSGAGLFDEEGHPSYQTILEIKPGQTRTWVLTLQEPAGDQPVTVVTQPGVLPLQTEVDDRSCS